ncbi:MAG TPA: hypothetical protein VFI49_13660 [Rudaea sp.]|nr:hypothetical protein [Rudaea sp.]
MSKLLAGLCCMLLLSAAYAAKDDSIEKPLVAQTLDGFNRESAQISASMQPGGRYEFLKPADKSRVEARMASMRTLLEAHAGSDTLNVGDKVKLANAQEEVNSILRHNDSNRLVCESRAPTGSHVPVTTCRSFGEIEEQRRTALHEVGDINNLSRTSVTPPGQGPGPVSH